LLPKCILWVRPCSLHREEWKAGLSTNLGEQLIATLRLLGIVRAIVQFDDAHRSERLPFTHNEVNVLLCNAIQGDLPGLGLKARLQCDEVSQADLAECTMAGIESLLQRDKKGAFSGTE
jgi:hypothetical protein